MKICTPLKGLQSLLGISLLSSLSPPKDHLFHREREGRERERTVNAMQNEVRGKWKEWLFHQTTMNQRSNGKFNSTARSLFIVLFTLSLGGCDDERLPFTSPPYCELTEERIGEDIQTKGSQEGDEKWEPHDLAKVTQEKRRERERQN